MTKTKSTNNDPDTTPDPASLATLPAANIKFCGRVEYDREKRKVVRPNDPIESFQFEGRSVELPSAAFQKRTRLFYHKSAGTIAAIFPNLYKLVRKRS
jgi:hypothetical protein